MQVYSLVCWGGRTGKTVTLTVESPCVVTLTNHGLHDGTRLVFSTTGALPTGITAGTTYYARYVTANTFHLYDTEAHAKDTGSTTGRINTSGTQSGTHKAKSRLMLDYFDQYPGRWGAAGSERCYDGLASWNSGRSGASGYDEEVCELGEAFDDIGWALTISIPAGATTITSKVNGVRSEAWHGGVIGAGYFKRMTPSNARCLTFSKYYSTADGFSVGVSGSGYAVDGLGSTSTALYSKAIGMMAIGRYDSGGRGISVGSAINCLATGYQSGFFFSNYNRGSRLIGCIAFLNTYGIYGYAEPIQGFFYNNISIGNTTANWYVASTANIEGAAGNAGLAGEAWYTGSNAQITVALTDFVNTDTYPYDLHPASSSSPQVDSGVEPYLADYFDIADAERPNYNNGGPESFDVGCYEFDHGYGNHPATSHISLTNIVSGSRVLITRNDTDAVLYNDVPGTSLSLSTSYIGAFTVIIRKASASPYYREFTAGGTTVADQTTTIQALQQLDE